MGQDVVTVGTFDGVHRGHQSVLAMARRRADELGTRCVAYTFDVPPRASSGDEKAHLLLPPATKRRLLQTWVDQIVEAPFQNLRHWGAEEFVSKVLGRQLGAGSVVVGAGFRFGRNRAGDEATLQHLAREAGIDLSLVPLLLVGGEPVSSTRIRSLLGAGDVPQAHDLLGRPPLIQGQVVQGDAIGRELGFPTANLRIDPRILLPRSGVYLSRAYYGGLRRLALSYCGSRPTLRGTSPRVEVHLLEAPLCDLLGTTLEIHLYSLLRPDHTFPTLAALREQMEKDRQAAHAAARRFPEAMDPDPFGG